MDSENFYRDILDNLSDGVYFTDLERRITYWNNGAEEISGYRRSDVLGKRCMDGILMHVNREGVLLCAGACPLAATMLDRKPRECEIFLHHKEGHRIPVRVRASAITDASGKVIGAVEIFSNNSDRESLAEQLASMQETALLDPLTQVGNRRFLEMHVRARLDELARNAWPFGILFFDIDRFKSVNDTYGHETGDRVIRMVARTLSANSRPMDKVGRWGGEDFLAVISNAGPDKLVNIGERLRVLVERSSVSEPACVSVTVSIGAAAARGADTVESLVARADTMLYRAKSEGRNCIRAAGV